MSRTRAISSLAVLSLLPALVLGGCRGTETTPQQAAAPTLSQEGSRPQQGTNWQTDSPPAVTGAPDVGSSAFDSSAAERERQLAEREAAVAQREAEVARREVQRAAPARVTAKPTTRRTSTARASAPAPRARRSETQTASRDTSPRYEEPAPAPRREPEPTRVTIPAGTTLTAEVTDGASTATSQVGDSVSARVAENVYAGGELAIPAGSRLTGTVTDVQGLRKVGGRARLAVRFDSVELPNGTRAPIYAAWSQTGRNETGRDAATIGGSAAGGAVLGRVLSRGH
ncbi:MAG TPA: TrbI/VirB10 family protein, partial [Thermoanaerobaculia bacterium]|nr:TrbI/VirB10 family protein [Thermoanaerobaculia bacterium]